jgi:hypothetical protein
MARTLDPLTVPPQYAYLNLVAHEHHHQRDLDAESAYRLAAEQQEIAGVGKVSLR